MSSAEVAKKLVKNLIFVPQIRGKAPKIFGGICKSTPPPTYWPSLVAIPWLVLHLC